MGNLERPTSVRLSPDILAIIDQWRLKHLPLEPRSVAIRVMLLQAAEQDQDPPARALQAAVEPL